MPWRRLGDKPLSAPMMLNILNHICVTRPQTAIVLLPLRHNTAFQAIHYNDVMMGAMVSQITSSTIVYSTVYSGADQRKHQSSASLAFVRGIHGWPVKSQHKWPVTQIMFPFDDVIVRRQRRQPISTFNFEKTLPMYGPEIHSICISCEYLTVEKPLIRIFCTR